jgi:hypothetical protein
LWCKGVFTPAINNKERDKDAKKDKKSKEKTRSQLHFFTRQHRDKRTLLISVVAHKLTIMQKSNFTCQAYRAKQPKTNA